MSSFTALIAEDEPLLRQTLERQLELAWPDLRVVGRARNGREAIELFELHKPDVCFLDVQMPGTSGIEAARHIGRRAHIVFVTAFDQYAIEAFSQGVLDYLVKPLELPRLAETIERLKERLRIAQPAPNTQELLDKLIVSLRRGSAPQPLRWLRASIGETVQLIPIEAVDFLRSTDKYTLVAWRDDSRSLREAVIRLPLKDIAAQLDAGHFAQVHRSVVVNLRAIDHVKRRARETAAIYLKGRDDVLPVSRNYIHLFRQM